MHGPSERAFGDYTTLPEALRFLESLKKKIDSTSYHLNSILEDRCPIPDGNGGYEPPAIVNDKTQDLIDQEFAETLFVEIREEVCNFMNSNGGIIVQSM